MKPMFFVAAAAALLASGCANHMGGHHMAHHQGGPHGGMHSAQDMQAMCDMHKQMMAGRTDAERRAIIDEHARRMSPEMGRHMQEMYERCK